MKFEPIARFASCLALILPLAAQESGTVSMKLDFVAWGPEIGGLTLKAGDGSEAITALPFRYSKPVAYSGPATLELHQNSALAAKLTEGADNSAPMPAELEKRRKEHPTLVALARLPSSSKRATILIAPAKAGTYQTVVIDDDPSKFPAGRLRVMNYSPLKIAMGFHGEPPRPLATRESALVTPREGEVTYSLAYDNRGKWKMQENNVLRIATDEQVQFIVLKSEDEHFRSSDGSRSGFLQTVVLRRPAKDPEESAP